MRLRRLVPAFALVAMTACAGPRYNQAPEGPEATDPQTTEVTQDPVAQGGTQEQGASRAAGPGAAATEQGQQGEGGEAKAEAEEPGKLDQAKETAKGLKEDAEGAQQDIASAQREIADLRAQVTKLQSGQGLDSLFTPLGDLPEGWQNINLRPDGPNFVGTVWKRGEVSVNAGVSSLSQGGFLDAVTLTGDWTPQNNPFVGRMQGGLLQLALLRPPTDQGATTQLLGVSGAVTTLVPGAFGANLDTVPFELAEGHTLRGNLVGGVVADGGNSLASASVFYTGRIDDASNVIASAGWANIGDGDSERVFEDTIMGLTVTVDRQWAAGDNTYTGSVGTAWQDYDRGSVVIPNVGLDWVNSELGGGAAVQGRYGFTDEPDAIQADGPGILLNIFMESANGSRIGPSIDWNPEADDEFRFSLVYTYNF